MKFELLKRKHYNRNDEWADDCIVDSTLIRSPLLLLLHCWDSDNIKNQGNHGNQRNNGNNNNSKNNQNRRALKVWRSF